MFRGLNVLGIPGSLRRGSFNRLLIKNAFTMLPEGSNAKMYDISAILLFNQDLEKDPPESVRDLKERYGHQTWFLFQHQSTTTAILEF